MNKKRTTLLAVTLIAAFSIITTSEAQTMNNGNLNASQAEQSVNITRSSSLSSYQGPAEYFTGSVTVKMLFTVHEPSRTTGGLVTFQPGARTAWHSHPYGQTLIVTEGTGRIQQWGGPIEEFRQGDVVWIPSGVKHWHGAAPTTAMTHIAIQEQLNGSAATWKEHVSDGEYKGKSDGKHE